MMIFTSEERSGRISLDSTPILRPVLILGPKKFSVRCTDEEFSVVEKQELQVNIEWNFTPLAP